MKIISQYPAKYKLFLSILLMVVVSQVKAQDLPNDSLKNVNDVDIWKKSLFKSVGVITYSSNSGNSIGTGTLISKAKISYERVEYMKIFLITNRHVLPSPEIAKKIVFKISAPWLKSEKKFVDVEVPLFDSLNNPFTYLKFNDAGEDIAVIDFTKFFANYGLDSLANDLAPFDILASDEIKENRNITIGDPIYFMGFPSFFYNDLNATPLLRTGTIATDPKEKYYFNTFLKSAFHLEYLNGFLIDANSFGGSSGSLIILKPEFSQMYSGEITHSFQKAVPYVLGILTSSYVSLNQGDNFQKLNLGGVISSKIIINTINQFNPK